MKIRYYLQRTERSAEWIAEHDRFSPLLPYEWATQWILDSREEAQDKREQEKATGFWPDSRFRIVKVISTVVESE